MVKSRASPTCRTVISQSRQQPSAAFAPKAYSQAQTLEINGIMPSLSYKVKKSKLPRRAEKIWGIWALYEENWRREAPPKKIYPNRGAPGRTGGRGEVWRPSVCGHGCRRRKNLGISGRERSDFLCSESIQRVFFRALNPKFSLRGCKTPSFYQRS